MEKVSIRTIKSKIAEYAQYRCLPRLIARHQAVERVFVLHIECVSDAGETVADTDQVIFDGRGKPKSVKTIDAVYTFAARYGIDNSSVKIEQ